MWEKIKTWFVAPFTVSPPELVVAPRESEFTLPSTLSDALPPPPPPALTITPGPIYTNPREDKYLVFDDKNRYLFSRPAGHPDLDEIRDSKKFKLVELP